MKWFLKLPADTLLGPYRKLRQRIRPAIYYPYQIEQGFYIVPKSASGDCECDHAGLPIPPRDLWAGYGQETEEYLSWGKTDIDKMTEILHSNGFFLKSGNRILELGCAAGRMLRWLVSLAEECEIWGLDVNEAFIIWCQQNLSPPFNFATVTTIPCLPFEDGYFDLIFCGSVFTHIDAHADAWLLELRRILRPGGRMYVTVADKHTIDLFLNRGGVGKEVVEMLLELDRKTNILGSEYNMFSIRPGSPASQVFYDIDYVCKRWERILKLISVTQEAYGGSQTAILLEK